MVGSPKPKLMTGFEGLGAVLMESVIFRIGLVVLWATIDLGMHFNISFVVVLAVVEAVPSVVILIDKLVYLFN